MAHDDCGESRSARTASDQGGAGRAVDVQDVLPTALEANTAAIHRLADGIGELVAAIRDSVPLELVEFDDVDARECGDCERAAGTEGEQDRAQELAREGGPDDSRPALALLPQPREGEDGPARATGCCQQDRVAAGRGRHARPDDAEDTGAGEQVGAAGR